MAEHVELTFSEVSGYIEKLSRINNNYYEVAYKSLKESTDFGSSLMQATWSFKGKKEIFEIFRKAEDKLKELKNKNESLITILNNLQSEYENSGNSEAKKQRYTNFKKILMALGIPFVITPSVFAPAVLIWGGKKIISYVGSKKDSTTKTNSKVSGKNNFSQAVTAFGITSLIKPISTNYNPSQVIGGPDTTINNLLKFDEGLSSESFKNLQTALEKYKNTPYVYGGSSTNGIDCSGLVMKAFSDAGIKTDFKHNAAAIYTQCKPVGQYTKGNVDLSNIKKGDLVFYSDAGTDSIKHVGIYMGDGNVMSAMNPSMGVVTKNIDYTYKQNIYVARVQQ